MKVLDLGSGAGDVALLLADLVGPQGRVIGVDSNAEILEVARARADTAGWANVEFRSGDIQQLDLGADFDAVVGRWLLIYVADPVDVLCKTSAHLRPGGIVAFQEGDLGNPPRVYPPGPVHQQVVEWTTFPTGVPGPDVDMGLKLFSTFLRAGIPAPQLRIDAPIGGGDAWPGYAYLAGTVRSLLPFIQKLGVASADEIDIDTLEERLRAEVVQRDGIQILPGLIGAWARI